MADTQTDMSVPKSTDMAAAQIDTTNPSEAEVEQTPGTTPMEDTMAKTAGDKFEVKHEPDDTALQHPAPADASEPANMTDLQNDLSPSSPPATLSTPANSSNEPRAEFEKVSEMQRAEIRSAQNANDRDESKHKIEPFVGGGRSDSPTLRHASFDSLNAAEAQQLDEHLSTTSVSALKSHTLEPASPWISEALDVIRQTRKKNLTEGDTLIVLDTTNFKECCLVESRTLFLASSILQKDCELQAATSPCVNAVGGLRYILVLENADTAMPSLVARPLNHTLPARHTAHLHSTAAKAPGAHVKQEHASDPSHVVSQPDTPGPQLAKAYKSFLYIVRTKKLTGVSTKDPDAALPQIESIVAIAESLHAIADFKIALQGVWFGWGDKLWESICKSPVRWMKVAIAVTNSRVFEEAFRHLAGAAASSTAGTSFRYGYDLPEAVSSAIASSADRLRQKRMQIDVSLLALTLPASSKAKEKKAVSHSDKNPAAYLTVNIFRDWMGDHISALQLNQKVSISQPDDFCKHTKSCRTVAGLYRLIHGKIGYLDPDNIIEKWNEDCYELGEDEFTDGRIRQAIARLKKMAAQLCASLTSSTLSLAPTSKEKLDYLTCVEVEAADFPWEVDADENGENDEAEDEDMDD